MVDPSMVRRWTDKADEDFGFASSILAETEYFAHVCFFFHQAAEKYLKAFIVAKELEFVKRHDLIVLIGICEQAAPSLGKLLDDCRFLNRFYIDTRYPVHWPAEFNMDDALKAKEAAQRIKSAIRSALSLELS